MPCFCPLFWLCRLGTVSRTPGADCYSSLSVNVLSLKPRHTLSWYGDSHFSWSGRLFGSFKPPRRAQWTRTSRATRHTAKEHCMGRPTYRHKTDRYGPVLVGIITPGPRTAPRSSGLMMILTSSMVAMGSPWCTRSLVSNLDTACVPLRLRRNGGERLSPVPPIITRLSSLPVYLYIRK